MSAYYNEHDPAKAAWLRGWLTDEAIQKAVDAYGNRYGIARAAGQPVEQAQIVAAEASRHVLAWAVAPGPGTCATCQHWLPVCRETHVRAQCNMGVSGSTTTKASHHPYPITHRDFGCTLHQPIAARTKDTKP